jgi:hypothetical protein
MFSTSIGSAVSPKKQPALIKATRLTALIPAYQEYAEAEREHWQDARQQRAAFFDEHLTMDGIEEMDEGALHELVHRLGAFRNWTNQEWLYSEILKSGLDTVKDAIWQLLYGDSLLESRFDFLKDTVRMMGAAAISEMLAQHDPTVYPIWNRRARRALIRLGVDKSLIPRSTQISGAQYAGFVSLMRWVLPEVRAKLPEIRDMLDLDFLFSYLALEDIRSPEQEPEPDALAEADFHHNEVVDQLLQLGDGLGFEVDKEVAIVPGCRIDAVWRTRIANLGTICYGFEVHRKGSRDSAIMNLQRVSTHPTVQKVVFVASRADLEMFRRETASLPESFRANVAFFEASDLQRALEHLQSLKTILNSLGLLNATALFE